MKKREKEYKPHVAVEPIPDHDWQGETWGLFWPDLEEFEELLTEPVFKKHYNEPGFQEPCDTCEVSTVVIAVCPKKEKTPPPPPPPAPVVIREKKPVRRPEPSLPPPPPMEIFNKERDNSKWGWMKDNGQSGRRARFSLSVYW